MGCSGGWGMGWRVDRNGGGSLPCDRLGGWLRRFFRGGLGSSRNSFGGFGSSVTLKMSADSIG